MMSEPSKTKFDQERLALLDSLAAGLAHEIRNPLSTLSVNLQLLAEDWENGVSEREKRSYNRIRNLLRETRRLEDTLSDFLRFAADKTLVLRPTQLNDVAEQTVDFVLPEAVQGGVSIELEADPDLPLVEIDERLYKQALYNVLLNAVQSLEKGGEVIVKTYTDGGRVCVDVIDNGAGIPDAVKAKIFDAYFSTRKGGTGLGLPTARRIVEEHQGELTVTSEPGRTVFTLCLGGSE
jgi:signal transduction histidine kinase